MNGKRKLYVSLIICALVALFIVSFCFVDTQLRKTEKQIYISSAEDLIEFRDSVNAGNRYDNVTVYQSGDIDLSGVKNWTPIGISNSGNYFYGSYNGQGYKILNMRSVLTDESSDNGLFGALAGKVYNVSLVNAYVNGGCLGGIASSSVEGSAYIFNCYVNATFEGTRGGAIADNFPGGKIMNCFADCKYVGNSNPVPLISYDAKKIANCYSTGKIYAEKSFTGEAVNSEVVPYSYYKTKEFENILNDNLFLICINNITIYNTLCSWKIGEDGIADFYKMCPAISSLTLEGKGTKSDPYLVSSLRDLTVVACGVNEGRSFSGYWLRQTVDFDLSCVDEWLPIGVYNSKMYFNGIYDGGGHTVSNIYSPDSGRSRNNGFFGMLGGTVMNLGVVNSSFYGECVGAIASHASRVAANIVNCYSTSYVEGYARSGGITDNFIGRVLNCVYYGEDESIPAVSYHADYLISCYSNTSLLVKDTFIGRAKDNYIYSAGERDTVTLEQAVENLNAYRANAALRAGLDESDLFEWKINGDSFTFDTANHVYKENHSSSIMRLLQFGGIAAVLGEALVLYYFLIYKRDRKLK